ncbi:zinc finger protein 57-like [Centruroides vittatus]|uniref:zinc finger protein 57-like n=1 Tax=Centruroides vittatus TaxID=120091 RepID=UPI00350ECBC1
MHVFEFRNLKGVSYRCEYCGRTFNTQSALQQHINKEHTRRSNSAGPSVSFKYKKYEEFLMDLFHNERNRCQYCGKMFKSELELQDHIKNEHSSQSNGASSDVSFKYVKNFMGVFDNERNRCQYCGRMFKSELELQNHINKEHSGQSNTAGSSVSFKDEEYKEFLMDVFDNERNRCQYCGRMFKSELELQDHIKKEHSGQSNGAGSDRSFKYEKNLMGVFDDEVYKCTYCGMLLKSETELREHIKQWHPNKTGSGSDGSFKYEEYGITRSEPFNVDHSIILYDSTFCVRVEIFILFFLQY